MLDPSLEYGISERDFWEMTPAEINRAVTAKRKVMKIEAQEKATFDYIHAGLLAKHISKILTGKGSIPDIYEAYNGIFDDIKEEQEKKLEQQKLNLSISRFKQFAQTYNNNFKNKGGGEK